MAIWEDSLKHVFQKLKAQLTIGSILKWPVSWKPFQLHIDWSILGVGTMFTYVDDEGRLFVVTYMPTIWIIMSNPNIDLMKGIILLQYGW